MLPTDDFIEDEPTVDTNYMHLADALEDSHRQLGSVDLFASIEERYGSGTTPRVAGRNDSIERPLESHPIITTSLTNIMRMPTKDDYPLWRVRCKVNLFVTISYCIF